MCYNLAVEATRTRFQKEFGWDPGDGWQSAERLNGFDHPFTPLLVRDHEATGWSLASWGLVPPWLSGEMSPQRTATLNARLETAKTKPSFRDAWQHGRAVVPATGFYEWRGSAKRKELILVRPMEGWLYLAALASWWERPQGRVLTWSLLTTESSGWFRDIHERMPVSLPADIRTMWLSDKPPDPHEVADAAGKEPSMWMPPAEKNKLQGELGF